ncbi:hypothetical protein IMZ31_23590 (plasmid) [Pontibacillus sp. ALD_SL1]|uniref:hypothetical protein n=1 Tax=Pontibacillus sp. ALD_SL1 TaxID=2777185 RepID=UPI001A978353|nr:hypothetical protein [Pontibacillus sp. ALD_SL1]QST02435.1 hypothetical protein IMZ31_23590 [Pontibacillus sp. ALD_SL1]
MELQKQEYPGYHKELRNGLFMETHEFSFPGHLTNHKLYTRESLGEFSVPIGCSMITMNMEPSIREYTRKFAINHYGFYFGETAVRTIKGAKWRYDKKEPYVAIYKKGKHVDSFYPHDRMRDIMNGDTTPLADLLSEYDRSASHKKRKKNLIVFPENRKKGL